MTALFESSGHGLAVIMLCSPPVGRNPGPRVFEELGFFSLGSKGVGGGVELPWVGSGDLGYLPPGPGEPLPRLCLGTSATLRM